MLSYPFICCNSNTYLCLGQVSGPDFEIFVDVTPGSITIDSVEATVLPNVPINTTEANGEYFVEYFHTLLKIILIISLLCLIIVAMITAIKNKCSSTDSW